MAASTTAPGPGPGGTRPGALLRNGSSSTGCTGDSSGTSVTGVGSGSGAKRLSAPRWLGRVQRWLSVSEPSAQALRAQKRTAYRRYGVDPDDPQAAAKMHLPTGKVPAGVTTSTRGPRPEKALRDRVARENAAADARSVSSGASVASSRRVNEVAPWAAEGAR